MGCQLLRFPRKPKMGFGGNYTGGGSFVVYCWFQSMLWWLQGVTLASLGLEAVIPVYSFI